VPLIQKGSFPEWVKEENLGDWLTRIVWKMAIEMLVVDFVIYLVPTTVAFDFEHHWSCNAA